MIRLFSRSAVSLIAAVFVMLALALLGLVGASMLATHTDTSLYSSKASQAFYIAEGAMQYELEDLSNDNDWSDRVDISDQPLGEGVFDVTYTFKSINRVIAAFTGRIGDVSREISQTITRSGGMFSDAIYAQGNINTTGAEDLVITGTTVANGSGWPTIDLSGYQALAQAQGQYVTGNKTFASGTYSGVWYVTGNISVSSNVVINGSIISEGNISMNSVSNITLTTQSPSNAVMISTGNFDFKMSENINITGFIAVGADASGNYDLKMAEEINIIGAILVGGNMDLKNTDDVSITYDPTYATPDGFSNPPGGGGGAITNSDWQEAY